MNYKTESPEWVTFYPTFSNGFYVEKAGYFDERPEIRTSVTQLILLVLFPFLLLHSFWFVFLIPFIVLIGWGALYIHLPIRTGIQDCESAAYGFNYHDNKIWIYTGGAGNFSGGRKYVTYTMPWDLTWVRTSTLMNDFEWYHETQTNRISWTKTNEEIVVGSSEWLNLNKWQETHPYFDSFDNTTINATTSVVEREWRPLAFQ